MPNDTERTDEEILSIWKKLTDGHGDRNDSHWFMVGYRQAEKSKRTENKSLNEKPSKTKERLGTIEEGYKNLTVWSAVITQVYLKQDVDKIFAYLVKGEGK